MPITWIHWEAPDGKKYIVNKKIAWGKKYYQFAKASDKWYPSKIEAYGAAVAEGVTGIKNATQQRKGLAVSERVRRITPLDNPSIKYAVRVFHHGKWNEDPDMLGMWYHTKSYAEARANELKRLDYRATVVEVVKRGKKLIEVANV